MKDHQSEEETRQKLEAEAAELADSVKTKGDALAKGVYELENRPYRQLEPEDSSVKKEKIDKDADAKKAWARSGSLTGMLFGML